jgi:hypothetical protein
MTDDLFRQGDNGTGGSNLPLSASQSAVSEILRSTLVDAMLRRGLRNGHTEVDPRPAREQVADAYRAAAAARNVDYSQYCDSELLDAMLSRLSGGNHARDFPSGEIWGCAEDSQTGFHVESAAVTRSALNPLARTLRALSR